MSLAKGYWCYILGQLWKHAYGQKGGTINSESDSVELIITEFSLFIAEQDSLETCMIGMDENLPIHLGDVKIEDVFEETPFEDLGGQIRLQYRTCTKDTI